jgi:cytochrome c-type biogenesis protein CcmH/NrfF
MFNFQPSDPGVSVAISSLWWVYWVITIPLTLIVVGLWNVWLKKRRKHMAKRGYRDDEDKDKEY